MWHRFSKPDIASQKLTWRVKHWHGQSKPDIECQNLTSPVKTWHHQSNFSQTVTTHFKTWHHQSNVSQTLTTHFKTWHRQSNVSQTLTTHFKTWHRQSNWWHISRLIAWFEISRGQLWHCFSKFDIATQKYDIAFQTCDIAFQNPTMIGSARWMPTLHFKIKTSSTHALVFVRVFKTSRLLFKGQTCFSKADITFKTHQINIVIFKTSTLFFKHRHCFSKSRHRWNTFGHILSKPSSLWTWPG